MASSNVPVFGHGEKHRVSSATRSPCIQLRVDVFLHDTPVSSIHSNSIAYTRSPRFGTPVNAEGRGSGTFTGVYNRITARRL